MKAPFATSEFPWETIDTDDFSCKINEYTLRVEKMDRQLYWWAVYKKEEPVSSGINLESSKFRAVGCCEGFYKGFLAK